MVPLKIELPDGFLDEEVRCGYTVSKQMKEVWAVELDLLAELLRVCKKHDIKIFASGGTLLGAIRHKGMIPWDDDIDMMMFREDYDKLCSVAADEFEHPYFFQTEYTDPGSLRFHAQLRNSLTTGMLTWEKEDPNSTSSFNQGIFIDIFPLDNVVEDQTLFKNQMERVVKEYKAVEKIASATTRYCPYAHSKINTIAKRIVHFWGAPIIRKLKLEERYFRKFEDTCRKYNDIETEYIGEIPFVADSERHIKLKSDYSNIKSMPFEFLQIPVGEGYDDALRRVYGDYMEYKIGNNTHGGVFFDVDRPYTEYVEKLVRDKSKL